MNTILMEIYDEYQESKTINKLIEFTNLTFPQDGTDKLFIGLVLILINTSFKNNLNISTLYTVALSAKEKLGNTNLLQFYMDRVNTNKIVSKYLLKELKHPDFVKHANLILDYLESRSYNFVEQLKRDYKEKIIDYIN